MSPMPIKSLLVTLRFGYQKLLKVQSLGKKKLKKQVL